MNVSDRSTKLDNPQKQSSSSPARKLRLRYVGGLCVVGALILANLFSMRSFISDQQADNSVASSSIELCNTVQRIKSLAQQIQTTENFDQSTSTLSELSAQTTQLAELHESLNQQLDKPSSDKPYLAVEAERIKTAYESFWQACQKIRNGGQMTDRYVATIQANEPGLTLGMQGIVFMLQKQAAERAAALQTSLLTLTGLGLLALALIGLTVLEPATRKMEALSQENREATTQLAAQLAAIDQTQARMELATDGVILNGNALLFASLGYQREELVGEKHHRLIPKSQQNVARQNDFWRQLASGEERTGEFERMTKDGKIRWLQGTYMPILGVAGEVERIAFYGTDISDRKSAELEHKRLDRELKAASKKARVADVANNTLHNVGNVLNSVNVSTTLLRERIDALPVDSLAKAAVLFYEHRDNLSDFLTNDNRGKNFPGFLEAVVGHVKEERDHQKDELQALVKSVEHIKQIVSKQQSMAQKSGDIEIVNPAELFEDALSLNDISLHSRIEFSQQFDYVPNVHTKRHETLQVLVNFIKNACQATLEADVEEKSIELRLTADDGFVCFEVQDNGIGIDSNMLEHIFESGYTTKTEGHGFGLHSCAQTAQDLGGTVSAMSEGRNRGATFILRIPESLVRPEQTNAANQSKTGQTL